MTAQHGHDPVLLLVHGAWHGSWSWATVPRLLGAAGIRVLTVDLPGRGRGTAGGHDLAAHAGYLRSVAEDIDGPVAVLTHSYGGAVATQALAGLPRLVTLIYLAAFLLFLFLPLTTLAYAWMVNTHQAVAGINLIILIVAVLIDAGGLGSSEYHRRSRWG